ncbi:MAG: hypothetical protein EON98_05510 [Chitinophagaceae bacterium]|nr:MAG: hypothetical protein EON98_05510 [Chitinophagaceae bacterium]
MFVPMKKYYCILYAMLLFCQTLTAQFKDSLSITAGVAVTVATKPYQPLWLLANQFGTLRNRQADVALHLKITNRHDFGSDHWITSDSSTKNFSLKYGFDIYNNNKLQSTFFKEAYLKFAFRNLELRAGRLAEFVGEVDPSLSSGSLGVSGNALPIPQVGLKLTRYVNVPLTKGWVQFKGEFSHGWFGDDSSVKNAFLHHKSAYLKFGKGSFQFYAGLNHFAQWGGSTASGRLPSRFKDYLRGRKEVFTGNSNRMDLYKESRRPCSIYWQG